MIRFLGGVSFAALLITLTALSVIYATYIEGRYHSHEVAVETVYQSKLFNGLLIGFFINIFISTLRRYPFKKKHLPFITTHIGLLMILSGTFIKNNYGIQGTMHIFEGSSSQEIEIAGSKALHINGISYPLKNPIHHEEMDVHIAALIPHTHLTYTSYNPVRPLGFKIESCQDLTAPPAVVLNCNKGDLNDTVALSYADRFAWPVFDQYLLSFQPHVLNIPHRIRLHQAQKICHPGSSDAASYEATVSIDQVPCTLKMNHVYETSDHFRFYLSSMSTPPNDAKQITLVVNYDPVRNTLTYPGALLVVIGAVFLFFRKKT
jgi:hypothetical protein